MANKPRVENKKEEVYKKVLEGFHKVIVADVSPENAELIKNSIKEVYSLNNKHSLRILHEQVTRLTPFQLNLLYQDYLQLSTQERFGQFIFNRTGFEFQNSYNIKNAEEAYKILMEYLVNGAF